MTPSTYISSYLPRMEGWCSPAKAEALVRYVGAHTPSLFLEIGVFAGRSLFAAALALPTHAHALGIDPWEADASVAGFDDENRDWWGKLDHDEIYEKCRASLRELKLEGRCTLLRSTSAAALPIVSQLSPFTMLHIDGNHSQESALFDVETYASRVPSGGIVIFDDCDWSTTKLAQARLATMCDLLEMVGTCGFFVRKA